MSNGGHMKAASRRVVSGFLLAFSCIGSAHAQFSMALPADFKSGFVIAHPGAAPQFIAVPVEAPQAGDLCSICAASNSASPPQCKAVLCAPPGADAQTAVFAVPPGLGKTRDLCFELTGAACRPLVRTFPRLTGSPASQPWDGPGKGPKPRPSPLDRAAYKTSLDMVRLSAEDLHKAGEMSATDFGALMKAYQADSRTLAR